MNILPMLKEENSEEPKTAIFKKNERNGRKL